MNRDEASKLVRQSRLIEHFTKPGQFTKHTCLDVRGTVCVSIDGVSETYDKVWTTAYEPGDTMWMAIDSWLKLPMV